MDSVKYIGNAADANSGIYHINEVNAGIKDGSWPTNYKIENSLRFDGTSYLSRTPTIAGTSYTTFTYSFWVKKSVNSPSDIQNLFEAKLDGNDYLVIFFQMTDEINIHSYHTSKTGEIISTAKYRDNSSWYHIIFTCDTTNLNGNDRYKLFVNGDRVINLSSNINPTVNYSTYVNTLNQHRIGLGQATTQKFYGYMANIHLIDGQALDPSHFATTHPVTGRWVPKPYRGTYGTNGFHLDFSNKNSGTGVGTIGEDKSGNGNHWTTNNLDHSDVVPDSPTNNFCTLNPLDVNSDGLANSINDGNLYSSNPDTDYDQVRATFYLRTGKWYWEVLALSTSTQQFGVVQKNYAGGNGERRMYQNDARKYSSSSSSYGVTFTNGDVIGIFLDLDNGEITFYKNGTTQNVAFTDLLTSIDSVGWTPALIQYNSTAHVNFGQDPTFSGAKVPSKVYMDSNNQGRFFYQPPEGALALCEANINQPEITPNQYPIDETNQHRLTYNGNVQQSKFTPYASDGYSINFDGSSELLYTNTNIYTLNLFDWMNENNAETDKIGTIEAWIYLQDFSTGTSGSGQYTDRCILGRGSTFLNFGVRRDGKLRFYMYNSKNQYWTETDNTVITLRRWHHVAVSTYYDSNAGFAKVRMFIDGIEKNSTSYDDGVSQGNNRFWGSDFTNTTSGYENIYIGREGSEPATSRWIGYIKDLRVTKDSLYTTNFSVPTSNLQKLTNTVLLIGNSKSLNDASDNAFIFSPVGQPSISDWSPYTPELVRKGVHFRRPEDYGGGSFYFDGRTGTTYLNTGYTLDFNTSFTIQGWFFCNGVGNDPNNWVNIFSNNRGDASGIRLDYNTNTGSLEFGLGNGGTWVNSSGLVGTAKKLEWNYFMITWDGTTYKMFLNENSTPITWTESVGSTTTEELYLGRMRDADTRYYWGYISDFRILRGTALDYEYPTAKLSTVTDTKLLLQPWQTATTRGVFTTPDTYKQEETGKSLTYVGNASVVNTSPYKNGVIGGFNSQENGNVISTNNHSDFNFGTGPFTMEAWIKREANSTDRRVIFNKGDRSVNSFNTNEYAWMITNTEFQIHYPGGVAVLNGSDLSGVNIYDWIHVVWERVSTSAGGMHFYVNGIKTSSHDLNYNLDNTLNFEIGGSVSGNEKGVGLYSDVRIVKGQALYGGTNFIPPAYPLSSTHYTTNGQDPSDSNSTRTEITGTVSLLAQPGTGFTKNSAAQNPKKYFNTLLYTGNGGTQSITGLDFKPDLVWIKPRSLDYQHQWYDSVRGALKRIGSSLPNAENTETETLKSFTSNGFTLGTDAGTNASSSTNVAWCWKAGGNSNTFNINGTGYGTYNELQTTNTSLPASSTSGMIVPSGMSINTDAGFSIVKWIGNNTNNSTIPHGLNKEPDFVIIKNTTDTIIWIVKLNPSTNPAVSNEQQYLYLNLPNNFGTNTGEETQLTSNTIKFVGTSLNSTNGSNDNMIAYCWHSVEGYSKFGSYTGNGSPDGPFVYCGFRPAFVMVKNTDLTGSSWFIWDSKRSPNNEMKNALLANDSLDELNDREIDFLSNGFKPRANDGNYNQNYTYIYMAFAEQPFTKTTAR